LRSIVRRIAAAAILAAACSKDTTAPASKPTTLVATQGVVTSGTAGSALSVSPTFSATDVNGRAVANVPVTITVGGGGGTLTGAPTKTIGGPTSVGTWTLGTIAGQNSLIVTAEGLQPITIIATGTAGPASKLIISAGGNQTALAGTALPAPIFVRVADANGNGVPNVSVSFAVSSGGGSLSGPLGGVSDLGGSVLAPTWKLGKTAIPQTMTAASTVGSLPVNATIQTAFTVDVRFFGRAIDPNIQAAFTKAAQRANALVVGDVPDFALVNYDVALQCQVNGVAPLAETVGSVIIYASVDSIDGPGKVIGSAGPCAIRNTSKIPIVGTMKFDVADLTTIFNDGRLNDVIFHEMLHVLGFGTLWDPLYKNLIINKGTPSTAYIGATGIAGCIQSGGTGFKCSPTIPLENQGGVGTIDGHWRESVFTTELMTGIVSAPGVANPLSLMTIGALTDLGYVTNTAVADTYVLTSASASLLAQIYTFSGTTYTDELLGPRHELSRSGQITRTMSRK
jgi:hypothetical protein